MKIESYIRNVIDVIEQIKSTSLIDREVKEILDIAEAYVKDSIHYLKNNDEFHALATIAYAEGLLDALRFLGKVKFEWKKSSEIMKNLRKVLVAGTFEILHPGHIAYLKYAWSMGRVIAIVSRDSTVRKIKKRDPIIPENQRLEVLRNITYVHKARLGYEDDMFRVVEEEKPEIIILGPNQPFREDNVKNELKRRGLNIEVTRMEEYVNCELCSTSKVIQKILQIMRSSQ